MMNRFSEILRTSWCGWFQCSRIHDDQSLDAKKLKGCRETGEVKKP